MDANDIVHQEYVPIASRRIQISVVFGEEKSHCRQLCDETENRGIKLGSLSFFVIFMVIFTDLSYPISHHKNIESTAVLGEFLANCLILLYHFSEMAEHFAIEPIVLRFAGDK